MVIIVEDVGVNGGKSSVVVLDIPVGVYNVTVTYNGNEKYAPATNFTNITVSKDTPVITVDVDDVSAGEDVVINVEGPSDLTGPILVDVDGVG